LRRHKPVVRRDPSPPALVLPDSGVGRAIRPPASGDGPGAGSRGAGYDAVARRPAPRPGTRAGRRPV